MIVPIEVSSARRVDGPSAPLQLLEREDVLDSVQASLARARGGDGSVLLIEGPAGIGKTSVLAELQRRASYQDFQVATARGGELEREHPFGVVRHLFEPLLRGGEESTWEGAAALARPVIFLDEDPGGGALAGASPDRTFAVLHGLYWLCVNLSARRPLLLALDDAHWADADSIQFLVYLGRRLSELPILVAGARRTDEPSGIVWPTEGLEEPSVRLTLPALSAAATANLLQRDLTPSPGEKFIRAVHEATRGNPFMIKQLCRAMNDLGASATPPELERVAQLAPYGIGELIAGRLGRLSKEAASLAEAASILGADATVARAGQLARLDVETAAVAADALVAAGILASVRPLEFVHPLVRRALYGRQPAGRRAIAHREAARILDAEGEPLEVVCGHLLAAPPSGDEWVCDQLRRGAAEALGIGAPSSAVAYLRRALAEPPPREERMRILNELGVAEMNAGDHAAAATLSTVAREASDPVLRAGADTSLARISLFAGDVPRAVELLQDAVRSLEVQGQHELWLAAQAELANAALLDTRTAAASGPALAQLRQALSRPEPAGEVRQIVLAVAACCLSQRSGEAPRARAMAVEAFQAAQRTQLSSMSALASTLAAIASMFCEDYEQAARVLDWLVPRARATAFPSAVTMALAFRSHLRFRLGMVADAEADAREVLELEQGVPMGSRVPAAAFLADALVDRAQLAEAREVVESVQVGETASGALAHILYSRARVMLAGGDRVGAVDALRDLGRRMELIGASNPATIPWRSALAEALSSLGPEAAAEGLWLAEEELQLASRAAGEGDARAEGRAVGVALLSAGRCSRGEARLDRFHAAVEALGEQARLERARALVALGAELRRVNRRSAAREPLQEAMDLAARSGARALVTEARDELQAAGGRPRSLFRTGVEALTPSERRVARMAAAGMSNPQIAQSLFVTRKTVEKHLGSVYRKLDAGSREDLAHRLAERG